MRNSHAGGKKLRGFQNLRLLHGGYSVLGCMSRTAFFGKSPRDAERRIAAAA